MIPGLGRFPGGGYGNPLQYSCLENPQGQRTLVGYNPWGCQELGMTERLSTHTLLDRSLDPYGMSFIVPCWRCSVTQLCFFVIPWTAAHQTSLSFTISQNLLKLISTEFAIQPPHPLLPPSAPALNLSQLRSFPVSPLFASGGHSTGASASVSVLPMNIQV